MDAPQSWTGALAVSWATPCSLVVEGLWSTGRAHALDGGIHLPKLILIYLGHSREPFD